MSLGNEAVRRLEKFRGMEKAMVKTVSVKCAKCGQEIFRYLKLSDGHLWHCWKPRIMRDYSVREGNVVKCPCGNIIGYDVGIYIKLRQKAFTW